MDRAAWPADDPVERVPISLLLPADSPRLGGEDAAHVRLLAESDVELPPILVHRASMRVIDGAHRLSAARLRGQDSIEVRYFDGSEAEAFVLAVRTNIAHGLPLSRTDREAAAKRIIYAYPLWSNRAIAAATGIAATTVASIRSRMAAAAGGAPVRIGRDGRVRPVNAAEGRRLASQMIADRPTASLREIAKVAGISPATARDVRERVHRGDDPVPYRQRNGQAGSAKGLRQAGPDRDGMTVLNNLRSDPSLRYAEAGRQLLRWLHAHAMRPGEWRELVDATPAHCAPVVAGLARGYAREWLEFARVLERRGGLSKDDVDAA
jgi:hypothetical protein